MQHISCHSLSILFTKDKIWFGTLDIILSEDCLKQRKFYLVHYISFFEDSLKQKESIIWYVRYHSL